jgi:hypothetical protein
MSSSRRAIRAVLRRTLGEERAADVIAAYVDTKSRLLYRITRDGRRSIRELEAMRDRHRGQRCFIIGNGPSLAQMDLSVLRDEITFGLNRIYLMFDRLGFETTYLVAINTLVIEQFGREMLRTGATKFVSWHGRRYLPPGHDAVLLRQSRGPAFSTDPTLGMWGGATVTYAAMQLAYYLGFSTVVLIGVDHSFTTQGAPHELVVSSGDDPNHFDPHYFGKGARWELPNLDVSAVAYQLAKERFEADGRRVLDATVGGKLDVFPKADFHALFARSQSSSA